LQRLVLRIELDAGLRLIDLRGAARPSRSIRSRAAFRIVWPGCWKSLHAAGAHDQKAQQMSSVFGREADGAPAPPWDWEDLDLWLIPTAEFAS